MKYSLLILLACLSLMNSNAQAPQGIPYQSVIRNGSGVLMINQAIHIRFSIHDSTMLGTVVYQETHTTTTSNLGMITLSIGQGTPSIATFSSINWGSGAKFMQVELDASGGNNYIDLGTQQMMSVPYALYAKYAGISIDTSLWSINGNSKLSESSFIGTIDTFDLRFKVNNTNAGFIDFRNSNTALGYNSLNSPNAGSNNISIGVNNLNVNSTGSDNIGIGNNTLSSLKTAFGNIAIGNNSQSMSEGAVANVSLGGNTLKNNTHGNGNTAIGTNALANFDFPVWLAAYNTAVGEGSMGYTTTGYRNNGFGAYSLHNLTTGVQNTAIGIDAGQHLQTGFGNVFLGNGTDVTDSSINQSVAIGWGAIVSNSNVILLGDTSNTSLNIGIGTANPQRKLHVKSVMRLEPINSVPLSPSKGDIYFDGSINKLRVYDGINWQNCWQDASNTLPSGTTAGEMMYWNGAAWVSVAPTTSLPGNQAKTLKFCDGVPTWEDCPAALATVTNDTASSITMESAILTGTVTNDGGAAVTSRGICWSTSVNPTVSLITKTINGTGIGSFSSIISNLTPSTTYYTRAYATNSAGTAYGNEVVFTTAAGLSIGLPYQGGIIAYILQPGDPGYDANVPHGLIAAPSDQSTGAEWGCYGTIISGADGTAIGTGNQNTIDIMTSCNNAGIAARLCGDLVLNGYSDWYLPSKDELNKLYLNQTIIGGFAAAYYWSSSEFNNNFAWNQSFYYGDQYSNGKFLTYYVRAVRAF